MLGKLVFLFQRKVALTLIGAALCGSIGALVVVVPFTTASLSSSSQTRAQSGLVAIQAVETTQTPGSPSATPIRSTSPSPTSPGSETGQLIDLQGTVLQVNTTSGTFTIRLAGGSVKTIVVTSKTRFQGDAQSLSGLKPGWKVEVKGVFQVDGTFMASNVTAQHDD